MVRVCSVTASILFVRRSLLSHVQALSYTCHSDEADAERLCEHHAQLAIEADGTSVEALNALCNLRLCQQRPEDAVDLAQRMAVVLKALGASCTPCV